MNLIKNQQDQDKVK